MRGRLLALLALLFVIAALVTGSSEAQSPFEGKTVRIIVGLAPGGGYDTYARLIARHLGKYIPGNPGIVVENMTGAGSLVSANHIFRIAKPDGLTVGHFSGVLFLAQAAGQPGIEFDARKFEFIGAPVKEDVVCALTKASGITTAAAWMGAKTPVKLGGISRGNAPDNTARFLKAALGLPIQVVSGYKGTAEVRLAVDSGELAGACFAWESMRATWRSSLESGQVVPVLQVTPHAFPDLPGVPLAMSLAKTDDARRLLQMAHNTSAYARPFALPPGTPQDRVRILRTAFAEALKDKALQAEAEKTKITVDAVTGEELERMVADIFTLDAATLARLKEILYN
jgi:tripartite-type tricarboxylate transporter receptor subunit TctC